MLLAPVPDGKGQVMVDGSHRATVRFAPACPSMRHLLTEGESELAISVVPLTMRSVYRALRARDLLPNVDRAMKIAPLSRCRSSGNSLRRLFPTRAAARLRWYSRNSRRFCRSEQGNSSETRVAPATPDSNVPEPRDRTVKLVALLHARTTGTELSSPRVRMAATPSYGSSMCQKSPTPSQRSGLWWPRAKSVGVPSRATRLRHERHPRRGHGLRRAKRLASQHRRRQAARPE